MSSGRGRLITEITLYDAKELRELQAAAKERAANLDKAAKKAADSFMPEEAAITRSRLRLWTGDDGEAGLLARLADQMSIYEPAFSDNGKEPAGQQEIFDGVPRTEDTPEPEEEPIALPIAALKAALILSVLSGDVGPEAFDKLDPFDDLPDERKIAFLGRAPLELLYTLEATDALELFSIALECLGRSEASPEVKEADVELVDRIATMVASHGATIAPYYEPCLPAEEAPPGLDVPNVIDESIEAGNAAGLLEETWLSLTTAQLNHIIDREVYKPTPEEAEVGAQEEEMDAKQEAILTHAAASSDEFKFAVGVASKKACERALEIVQGLEGHSGREKALRKRISFLEGEPGAAYDLTEARVEALRVLATAAGAVISARVTDAGERTINWAASNYLEEQGLATEVEKGDWRITTKGSALAAEMGLTGPAGDDVSEPAEEPVEEPEEELAAVPGEADVTGDLLF